MINRDFRLAESLYIEIDFVFLISINIKLLIDIIEKK